MKKTKLATLLSIGLIGGGLLTSIPFATTSCGNTPPPTPEGGYLSDGSNWAGKISGSVTMTFEEGTKTCTIASSSDWKGALNIPDKVTRVGTSDEYRITGIGELAFSQNKLITSLTFSDGLIFIGTNSFFYDSGIVGSLVIPSTVTTIGVAAFQLCSGLTSLNLGNVSLIGSDAFISIPNLVSVSINPSNTAYKLVNGNDVQTTITNGFLRPVEDISRDTVTRTFGVALGAITFSDFITTIDNSAFLYCASITSLNLNKVISIGDNNFQRMPKLQSISVSPDNEKFMLVDYNYIKPSINNGFLCDKAEDLTMVTEISATCGSSGGLAVGDVKFPHNVWFVHSKAFYRCWSMSSFKFNWSGSTIVEDSAFSNCNGLTSLNFDDPASTFGNQAFNECNNVSTINCIFDTLPGTWGTYLFTALSQTGTVTNSGSCTPQQLRTFFEGKNLPTGWTY